MNACGRMFPYGKSSRGDKPVLACKICEIHRSLLLPLIVQGKLPNISHERLFSVPITFGLLETSGKESSCQARPSPLNGSGMGYLAVTCVVRLHYFQGNFSS